MARRSVLFVASLMVVGLAIRLWGIGQTNLWLDEQNVWGVSRLPWGAMFDNIRGSPVAPLYFILLKLWVLLFGDSEAALRTPSAIAGVLLIPVTYAMGVRLLSPRAAAYGALLVTLSPLHLYFAQEARMYMLLALIAGLAVLAYTGWRSAVVAIDQPWRAVDQGALLYALGGVALLFTNVVAAPLLVSLNVDAALVLFGAVPKARRGRALRSWAVANVAIVACYLLYLAGTQLNLAASTQGWRGALGVRGALRAVVQYPLTAVHGIYYYPHDFARLANQVLDGGPLALFWQQRELVIVEPVALLAITVTLLHVGRRSWLEPARVLLLGLIIPLAIAAYISITRELDMGRYVLFASPFLYLLMADGLTRMATVGRWLTLAVLVPAMCYGIGRYDRVTSRDSDYRPAAQQLLREAVAGDSVVLARSDVVAGPLSYYWRNVQAPTLRQVPDTGRITPWLPAGPAARAWVVFDYRSPLFGASPDSLQAALGARVVRDRYEGAVRLVLAQRAPDATACDRCGRHQEP